MVITFEFHFKDLTLEPVAFQLTRYKEERKHSESQNVFKYFGVHESAPYLQNLYLVMDAVHDASIMLCFASKPSLSVLKRPRASQTPVCRAAPLQSLAAAISALLLMPNVTPAKGILSTNTIFRRYVVTDSDAILRYALPLPSERSGIEPVPIRQVQEQLERLGVDLRARGAAGLISGRRDLGRLRDLLTTSRLDVLLDLPAKRRQEAAELLSKLEICINEIEDELGTSSSSATSAMFPPQVMRIQETISDAMARRNSASKKFNYDASYIDSKRRQALYYTAKIEELAVEGNGLPYRIPRRYNSLPRLTGRASVQMKMMKRPGGLWYDENGESIGREVVLTAVLDGYSAPITAGNFLDIAKKGYYNKTRVLASQKEFYAQMGEREDDKGEGYVEPSSGTRRQIPLEILVDGESAPTYGATLDELGIGDLQPVLPITAYGAMAMVHSVEDPNDASSQFYVFLLDPTSYTARSFGGSALTGSLSTFGYVVDGKDYLSQMETGDTIASVNIVSGQENFLPYGDS